MRRVGEIVAIGGAPARLDDVAAEFLRRRGPDGITRTVAQPVRSEVVITDGPLRGFPAMVERRSTAHQRVLPLLDVPEHQTRIELPEQWIRQA